MDFEKFKESLIEDVQQGLYEKGIEANVSTNKVSKLNESYEALTVGDFMSCHQTAHSSCHWIAPFSGNGNL